MSKQYKHPGETPFDSVVSINSEYNPPGSNTIHATENILQAQTAVNWPQYTYSTPFYGTYSTPFYGDNSMTMSPTIRALGPALLRAQTKMANAVKDSKNPFFKSKYADLNAIREACTPALHAEGILLSQPIIQKDGKSFLRTLLIHAESGEYLGSDVELLCAKQNDPQAMGSSISYARRYGLQALVSLGAEDDDGQSASRSETTARSKSTTKPASFETKTEEGGW